MGDITRIGDYTISEADIDAFISTLSKEQQMYASIPQFRDQVRGRLEEISLFAMYAKDLKITEKDSYKNAMMNAERDIAGQLAMAETIDSLTVTEEEAKEIFEKDPSAFSEGPKATAKHILVDSEEKANSIKTEIESGSKSFEEAAKEYSSCPSAQKGGSLGTFGQGQMVPEFDQAVFEGDLNTILGPVQTQFGYHLIWIDERTSDEVPSFDDVKESVRTYLIRKKQQTAYDEKLAELRAKYVSQ